MRFEFATATRIVYGAGAVADLDGAVAVFGSTPLLVTGASGEQRARSLMSPADVHLVSGEPTIDSVRKGVDRARESRCDVVVSFGGGSAIDAGKAIAALLTNGGDPLDYAEVIGAGKPLGKASAPFIAVPTTAGTGSEVTRNAVLGSPEHGVKVSLRSPHMLARLAIVDPELTYDLPRDVTAHTGLDALTQLLEPFVSVRANPMTDGFCREGLEIAAHSLRRAYVHGDDHEARAGMSLASLLSGLALANAGLGAVHGFAAPIGGMFHAPHGAVCAALLPHATAVNMSALWSRAPHGEALRRYEEAGRILTSSGPLTQWLAQLVSDLAIPPLRDYGVSQKDVPMLVEKAKAASSMKSNPIVLTTGELTEILEGAL